LKLNPSREDEQFQGEERNFSSADMQAQSDDERTTAEIWKHVKIARDGVAPFPLPTAGNTENAWNVGGENRARQARDVEKNKTRLTGL
jgi:hypothetical protein